MSVMVLDFIMRDKLMVVLMIELCHSVTILWKTQQRNKDGCECCLCNCKPSPIATDMAVKRLSPVN